MAYAIMYECQSRKEDIYDPKTDPEETEDVQGQRSRVMHQGWQKGVEAGEEEGK